MTDNRHQLPEHIFACATLWSAVGTSGWAAAAMAARTSASWPTSLARISTRRAFKSALLASSSPRWASTRARNTVSGSVRRDVVASLDGDWGPDISALIFGGSDGRPQQGSTAVLGQGRSWVRSDNGQTDPLAGTVPNRPEQWQPWSGDWQRQGLAASGLQPGLPHSRYCPLLASGPDRRLRGAGR